MSANGAANHRNLSSRPMARFHLLAVSLLGMMTLCGAVPPDQGTTATVGLGYAEQKFSIGCGVTHAQAVPAYVSIRQPLKHGWSYALESTLLPFNREGVDVLAVSANARLGYSGRWGGIELGPRFLLPYRTLMSPLGDVPIAWSGQAWLGRPEQAYLYLRSFTGPDSVISFYDAYVVGLGHKGKRFELELGQSLDLYPKALKGIFQANLHSAFKVSPELWLGFDGVYLFIPDPTDSSLMDRRAMLTLSYRPAHKQPAKGTVQTPHLTPAETPAITSPPAQ